MLAGPAGVALAGCAAEGTTEAAGPDRSALVQACAAAVAAHVGKGVDAVTAEWTGLTPEGIGVVTVSDAQAPAASGCTPARWTAAGRVLAIRHPGA